MFFAFEFRTIRGSFTMSLQCSFSKLMYLLINKSMECECNRSNPKQNSKRAVLLPFFFARLKNFAMSKQCSLLP